MPEETPADLLRRRLDADPASPLVTFYDDATGERVELSARTFDNWVAKTANMLVDGLGAQPGDRVVLALPQHWQTAAWLFACWSAGLVAQPVDPPADLLAGPGQPALEPDGASPAYFLAASEEVLPLVTDTWGAGAEEVVGLSLHALGGPLRDRPAGVLDYAVEVRAYADRFFPYARVEAAAPALRVADGTEVTFTTLGAGQLVREAAAAAAKWGLDAQARVLVDVPFTTLHGLLVGLLAPLAAGGSVIICRNLDLAVLDRRVISEHVTAVAGVEGWEDVTGSVRRLH